MAQSLNCFVIESLNIVVKGLNEQQLRSEAKLEVFPHKSHRLSTETHEGESLLSSVLIILCQQQKKTFCFE